MLYDRDYMRNGDASPWRSPVVVMLVVLGAVFLMQCILGLGGRSLEQSLGLSAAAVGRHEYWRLLTYQFLHTAPAPWHILFNGLALWFFGRPVLEAVGRARFWQIYFVSGGLGGLLEIAFQAWYPPYLSGPTVGASASVLGLAGAYCLLHSGDDVMFFFYVLPVRMRALTMFWVLLGFSAFGTIFPYGKVAHAAHLGGILAGAGFVRLFSRDDPWAWFRRFVPRRPARRLEREIPVAVGRGGPVSTPRAAGPSPEPETPDEFIRREVDPILDKISAHGIQSLTDRERRILERARERMGGGR